MRYAGIIYNDTAAAPGLSVSLYTQGCPHKCKGCHNPETWDIFGGYEYTKEVEDKIVKAIGANGIIRNLCIMGGEPLYPDNLEPISHLINACRKTYGNNIRVFLWTGYTMEEIMELMLKPFPETLEFFKLLDYVIDGRYQEEKRDITLHLRGSFNQNIYYIKTERPNYVEQIKDAIFLIP